MPCALKWFATAVRILMESNLVCYTSRTDGAAVLRRVLRHHPSYAVVAVPLQCPT